jgi:hypothetical protein
MLMRFASLSADFRYEENGDSSFDFFSTVVNVVLICQRLAYDDRGKQRLIVLTDITNEPDGPTFTGAVPCIWQTNLTWKA